MVIKDTEYKVGPQYVSTIGPHNMFMFTYSQCPRVATEQSSTQGVCFYGTLPKHQASDLL